MTRTERSVSSSGRKNQDRWIFTVNWNRSRRKASSPRHAFPKTLRFWEANLSTPAQQTPRGCGSWQPNRNPIALILCRNTGWSQGVFGSHRALGASVSRFSFQLEHRLRQLRCSQQLLAERKGFCSLPTSEKHAKREQAQELLSLHRERLSAHISQSSTLPARERPVPGCRDQPRAVRLADASLFHPAETRRFTSPAACESLWRHCSHVK